MKESLNINNEDFESLGRKNYAKYALSILQNESLTESILQNDSLTDDKKIAAFKDCCKLLIRHMYMY